MITGRMPARQRACGLLLMTGEQKRADAQARADASGGGSEGEIARSETEQLHQRALLGEAAGGQPRLTEEEQRAATDGHHPAAVERQAPAEQLPETAERRLDGTGGFLITAVMCMLAGALFFVLPSATAATRLSLKDGAVGIDGEGWYKPGNISVTVDGALHSTTDGSLCQDAAEQLHQLAVLGGEARQPRLAAEERHAAAAGHHPVLVEQCEAPADQLPETAERCFGDTGCGCHDMAEAARRSFFPVQNDNIDNIVSVGPSPQAAALMPPPACTAHAWCSDDDACCFE